MEAVIVLLVVLLGVSYGVETQCDATQNGTQCYGAVGGTVVFQLTHSNVYLYRWHHNNTKILDVQNEKNQIRVNEYKDRAVISLRNGAVTVTVSNISWTDSGEYSLDVVVHKDDPSTTTPRKLQMHIEAPVSSPRLSSECLSQGEKRVSCSSEGSSPRYSWTLDGRTLMDTEILSAGKETNSTTLKRGLSGTLSCSVKNNVSSAAVSESVSPCEGLTFFNCTLLNGTYISQWLFQDNDTQCIKTTTTAPTTIAIATTAMGKETSMQVSFRPSTHIIPSNQTVVSTSTDDPWYIKHIPIIAGSLSAMVILLMVAMAVYCFQMKNKKAKAKGSEDAEDVTYADVRVVQRQGMQMENKEEMEVEYSQVNVMGGRRQHTETTQDDCVYAKVRVKR